MKIFLKKTLLLILIIIAGAVFYIAYEGILLDQSKNVELGSLPGGDEATIRLGGTSVIAEIADTQEERNIGLSGREHLAPRRGMLFIFDTSGRYGFWMKDTLIPLDIIWINKTQEIVHIEESVSPDTYPQTFTSPRDAMYVLEVNAGFSEENNLNVGDLVSISGL